MDGPEHGLWWREVVHLFLVIAGTPLLIMSGALGVGMLVVDGPPGSMDPLFSSEEPDGFTVLVSIALVVAYLMIPGLHWRRASSGRVGARWQAVAGAALLIEVIFLSWIGSGLSQTGIDSDAMAKGVSFGAVLNSCWPLTLSSAVMFLCGIAAPVRMLTRVAPLLALFGGIFVQRGLW